MLASSQMGRSRRASSKGGSSEEGSQSVPFGQLSVDSQDDPLSNSGKRMSSGGSVTNGGIKTEQQVIKE